ncbi:hypothetical protein Cni_G08152 [Canna indica]|uniref:N-acetyltransferase domain-containing protein n=1 Tax=Canna indica TaxID=4628 RepID=A0AAQ3K5B4_9LILI|nr:hypothetical protein Cni_G08152 [Canna indica]
MQQEQQHHSPPAVSLRPFSLSESDVAAVMTWASDPRVTRFQRRGPFTSKDDARRYIADHILPHPWYRAICVGGRRVVGSITVKPAGAERHRASIGYRLAYDYWGRGIATAALGAAVSAVSEEWPDLERLEAVADVENPASQRVLEKAGFRREGVLRKYVMLKGESRDVVMYSLLATDNKL